MRRSSPLLESPINPLSPLTLALAGCLGLAAAASYLGLAAIIGAFLAGMVVAEADQRHTLERQVQVIMAFLARKEPREAEAVRRITPRTPSSSWPTGMTRDGGELAGVWFDAMGDPIRESLETLSVEIARHHEERLAIERPLWEKLRQEPVSLDETMREALRDSLRRLMSDVSEDYYCAGWLTGLEFTLWKAATEGPIPFGMSAIPALTCLQLARLAELCSGWWRWSDEAKEEVFVPMGEWLAIYRQHAEMAAARPEVAEAHGIKGVTEWCIRQVDVTEGIVHG
jgi:sodium/hydrogen exchanger family protein